MRFLSRALPIIITGLLLFTALSLLPTYPVPPNGIAAEKYDGFSGVLTISFSDRISSQFPHIKRWLTEITILFEKSNRGIYLRCTDSPGNADILLCSAEELATLPHSAPEKFPLLPAFRSPDHAVAVAADGYILGINGDIPASLAEISVGWNDGLALPWIALCEQFSRESTGLSTVSAPDIGLTVAETPIPTTAPAAGTRISRQNQVEGTSDELFSRFLAGEIGALPLSGMQAAKIRAGQSDGKFSSVRLTNAAAYTDRTAYALIPVSGRTDAAKRAAAAADFIEMLIGDEAQRRLRKYDMFPTAMIPPVYEGVPGMDRIESMLRRSDCVTHAQLSSEQIDDFLDGRTAARELMRSLRNSG